jgi:superfamily II helicase
MEGYTREAPNGLAEMIDRPIAEAMTCRRCKSKMRYEPYYRRETGSYIALAVCPNCGAEVEF